MKPRWEDLNARSRGLATHLLTRGDLAVLARAPDLPALAAELEARGYVIEDEARASPAGLELAARRRAAAQLRTLGRWCGPRTEVLAVVFEDEDRRSLRALVRGAVARASVEARLSGLVPTPALPERALEELARQSTPGAVAATLVAWNNPYGPALLPAVTRPEPDLLRLELEVNRTFAARALRAARRAGRRGLLADYVREVIDIENAYSAMVLAGERRDDRIPDVFLPGGRHLDREVFAVAARAGSPAAAAARLSPAFGESRLAGVFREPGAGPADFERSVLAAQVAELRQRTLHQPLGPAPLLQYALRLRAEVLDVRRIIWGLSLGAPPDLRAGGRTATATGQG